MKHPEIAAIAEHHVPEGELPGDIVLHAQRYRRIDDRWMHWSARYGTWMDHWVTPPLREALDRLLALESRT